MSVYTRVLPEELSNWLKGYQLNAHIILEPIAEGITNTNYFVVFPEKKLVLTLFEKLMLDEVPFYLQLMRYLALNGLPCPLPLTDQQGRFTSMLSNKPACLVTYITGKAVTNPSVIQCHNLGQRLATMHLAGCDFPYHMDNPRGSHWWNQTIRVLCSTLSPDDAKLLQDEIRFQNNSIKENIPKGIIHADLFKDNVLMDKDNVVGFIDFYYACNDYLIYDIAITLNSWAALSDGDIDTKLAHALLAGYQSVRSLSENEIAILPTMLRAAALRFWLSRLQDSLHPTLGELTYIKNPEIFRIMLLKHRERHSYWL